MVGATFSCERGFASHADVHLSASSTHPIISDGDACIRLVIVVVDSCLKSFLA